MDLRQKQETNRGTENVLKKNAENLMEEYNEQWWSVLGVDEKRRLWKNHQKKTQMAKGTNLTCLLHDKYNYSGGVDCGRYVKKMARRRFFGLINCRDGLRNIGI